MYTDYKVVSAPGAAQLTGAVQASIVIGWQPYGQMQIAPNDPSGAFAQPMVKGFAQFTTEEDPGRVSDFLNDVDNIMAWIDEMADKMNADAGITATNFQGRSTTPMSFPFQWTDDLPGILNNDSGVTDTNYQNWNTFFPAAVPFAECTTVSQMELQISKFSEYAIALAAKLNADTGVADTDYYGYGE